MHKLYFIFTFFALLNGQLAAQTFYSFSGPCSDDDLEVDLIATLGNDLIYADRTDEDSLWRFRADEPLNPTLLLTGSFSVDDINKDYMLLMSGNELYRINKNGDNGFPQLILTAGGDIKLALIWNDQYYYTAETSSGGFNDDGLFVYDPTDNTTTELYVSEFAGFKGLGALDNVVIAFGNTESGKGIVRTDGTIAGTEEFKILFSGGSEFFRSSETFVTSDGDLMYFFYGASSSSEDQDNVLFVTDGSVDGTDSLGNYKRIAFDVYPDPVINDGMFYFVQTALESPSGQTESLYRSDGTATGTINLDPTPNTSYLAPERILTLNDEVYTIARNTSGSITLYRTNGNSLFLELSRTVDANVFRDSLVLSHRQEDDSLGIELFQSSVELDETRLLADVVPGTGSSVPRQITPGDDVVYFVNSVSGADVQIYTYDTRTDNSSLTAVMVENIEIEPDAGGNTGGIMVIVSGNPQTFTLSNGEENANGIFTNLAAGEYQVDILDIFNCVTSVESIVVPLANRLDDYSGNAHFKLYPNPLPIGGTLSFGFLGQGGSPLSFVRLYGSNGQMLKTLYTNDRLQFTNIPGGLYWLTGYDQNGDVLFGKRVVVY